MAKFYVNRASLNNGEHEIHRASKECVPSILNRAYFTAAPFRQSIFDKAKAVLEDNKCLSPMCATPCTSEVSACGTCLPK